MAPQLEKVTDLALVTGPSGAGRSTAIRILEDLGFEAIDNLPLSLLPRLLSGTGPSPRIALGIDARNRDFSTTALIDVIDTLARREDVHLRVLYLNADTDTLVRRFSETRRPHPMAPAESAQVGITKEHNLLAPIRARADLLIDTSTLAPDDLRSELTQWFAPDAKGGPAITVQSFSFRRGLPRSVDMVFDVRFLRNPYWDPALRTLNGRDQAIAEYIRRDADFASFESKVSDLVKLLLPRQKAQGKAYLSVAFGCTGGQHRSVFMAETLAQTLAEDGWPVSIRHRELERMGSLAG